MITDPLQWRLVYARQLVERMRPFPAIRAVVVGGSVARGLADDYSDLELPVVWESCPADETRLALVRALQGEFLRPYDGPANEDNLFINGFQVDLWHNTVAGEEAVIASVLQDYNTDLGASNFMDTIRSAVPLYGHAIIQRWKDLAAQYPHELAVRNVRAALEDFGIRQLDVMAHRDNPTVFYEFLCRLQQAAFLVLLALNRMYFPTYKWMYAYFESMSLKPDRIGPRCRQVFRLPYPQAVTETLAILLDVLDLVDRHLPQVDTASPRRYLALRRTPFQGKPG